NGPSTTKSVSMPSRPSATRTQSKTSKARRNSAGGSSPAGRTRIPKVVSKKPRRANRSFSARIVRCSASKNSRDGNTMGIPRTITQNSWPQKAFSGDAGRRLRGGFECQGRGGQLAPRRTEEAGRLAQHVAVIEEPPVSALRHHDDAFCPVAAAGAVERVGRRNEQIGPGEDGELLHRQRLREV